MGFDDSILVQGPAFDIDLPNVDASHPVHYPRRLLIFRCASSSHRDQQLAALKHGLQKLVLRCPLLAGTVVPLPDGKASKEKENWRTIVPGQGLELVVKDLSNRLLSFDELERTGFRSSDLPFRLLVPIPQGLDNTIPFAACKVQYSAIDGGTIVTFVNSHSVGDGTSIGEMLRVWSEETRLAQQTSTQNTTESSQGSKIGIDRRCMTDVSSTGPFNIDDHPGYGTRLLQTATNQVRKKFVKGFECTKPEVPVVLFISAANLAKLKEDATSGDTAPISTHDALSALIWRSTLLIRGRRGGLEYSQDELKSLQGQLYMPSDARRHLKISQSYIGNVIYQLGLSINLDTLFSPSGLKHAATAIRKAIKAVNPTVVSSLVAEQKHTWVNWAFPTTMLNTGVAMGTGWDGIVYTYDWGESFGPLVRFRYPDEAFSCVYPKLPSGDAEIQVSVQPDEVELLRSDECFGKYIAKP